MQISRLNRVDADYFTAVILPDRAGLPIHIVQGGKAIPELVAS
jgi:hypothetical protein